MLHHFACELCCQSKVAEQIVRNPTRMNHAAKLALQVAVEFKAATAPGEDEKMPTSLVDAAWVYAKALFDRHYQPGMQVTPQILVQRAMSLATNVEAAVDRAEKAHEEAEAHRRDEERRKAYEAATEAEKEAMEAQRRAEEARKRAQGQQGGQESQGSQEPAGNSQDGAEGGSEPQGAAEGGNEGDGAQGDDGDPDESLTLEELKAMAVSELRVDNVTKNRLITSELKTVGEAMAFRQSREFSDLDITEGRAEKLDAEIDRLKSLVK